MGLVLPEGEAGVSPMSHRVHVGLIDESRGLQRMTGALHGHVAARQIMQLSMHEKKQLLQRLLVQ